MRHGLSLITTFCCCCCLFVFPIVKNTKPIIQSCGKLTVVWGDKSWAYWSLWSIPIILSSEKINQNRNGDIRNPSESPERQSRANGKRLGLFSLVALTWFMENKRTTTLRLCLQLNIRVCWLHPAALLGIRAFIFLGCVFTFFFLLLFYFILGVNLHHEIDSSLREWSWSMQER